MYYYKPDNDAPRRWARIAAGAYFLLLGAAFWVVSIDVSHEMKPGEGILIEFEEPRPVPPPKPPRTAVAEPQHATVSPEESFDQVRGSDPKTQTVNPKALFKMAKDGPDEPEDTGNPKAESGPANTASGTATGLDAVSGNLDRGLQGRGLVGALPKPAYDSRQQGKVVIDVTVDASGKVTSAEFNPRGSTTSDARLVAAAKAAARKARFTESEAFVQGGSITYVFRME